ncbi:MAG: hypothetical protein JJT82_08430 [Legionellaceae bacterium]|nr:hypothetical protein [Legionellaceae bacterium]
MLNLYALQGNTRDLQAAQNAGDWLVTKIKADGQVTHTGRCQQGTWQYSTKQSFLYAGQMLSALSRLYSVTKHPAYYQGATKIAQRLLAQVEKQQAFVGDDFRAPNTISTSWATLALMDYAKINPAPVYRQRMEQTADALLARQMTNQQDVYNYGRYWDTMTSSGNGWINEVMGELYPFCVQQNMSHCGRYREAMILTTRWLMQNAYTAANSYNIPNPQQAIGGFIRNYIDHSVRIDAVCHGVNSLLSLMQITSDQPEVLVDLAEEPLDARIGLLRIGKI